jgi:LysM repeat protein
MQLKRFVYFILINILVSALTTLIVLTIWDRTHTAETSAVEPVAALPEFILPTATIPVAIEPATPAVQSYQISAGETLSDVAFMFDVSVDELLQINGFTDPDSIGAGTVIFVPVESPPTEAGESDSITEGEANPGEVDSIPIGQVEITAVIGAGDLASERVQLRGIGEGSLDLTGWRLRDENNNEYIFPQITLFANGAVNVYTSAGVDTVVALYWGASSAVWSSGETVTLLNGAGNTQATYQVP